MFSLPKLFTTLTLRNVARYSKKVPQPLRSKKPKSNKNSPQYFVDLRKIRTFGGRGGDGCISFLHLWANENAGPDGGDGGNGGHVILRASTDVKDLNHISAVLRADFGERGANKDCNGKNAAHKIILVPTGTIVKDIQGTVVADLNVDGTMFVAARGGAGGKGNHFFVTDTEQAPKISEYGAIGEDIEYKLEIRSMAHVGLIGLPNAGKSTLLRAISRARPKVAPYPFTTLKPHLGMIQYDDYEQIAVADLPGLIPDSHKNKGLGIQFLKHAERCTALLYVLDISCSEPWKHLETLQYELSQFSSELHTRPQVIVANKIDVAGCEENLATLQSNVNLPVIPVSAKYGTNLLDLLKQIRIIYDNSLQNVEEYENKR
ncbi:uncharacterized protein CBL_06726 [Carabus blaptoides fortunei]